MRATNNRVRTELQTARTERCNPRHLTGIVFLLPRKGCACAQFNTQLKIAFPVRYSIASYLKCYHFRACEGLPLQSPLPCTVIRTRCFRCAALALVPAWLPLQPTVNALRCRRLRPAVSSRAAMLSALKIAYSASTGF